PLITSASKEDTLIRSTAMRLCPMGNRDPYYAAQWKFTEATISLTCRIMARSTEPFGSEHKSGVGPIYDAAWIRQWISQTVVKWTPLSRPFFVRSKFNTSTRRGESGLDDPTFATTGSSFRTLGSATA